MKANTFLIEEGTGEVYRVDYSLYPDMKAAVSLSFILLTDVQLIDGTEYEGKLRELKRCKVIGHDMPNNQNFNNKTHAIMCLN